MQRQRTAPLRKILQVLPSRIDAFVLPDLVPPRPRTASLAAGGGAFGSCTDMYGIRSANPPESFLPGDANAKMLERERLDGSMIIVASRS